jgi:hypothetical protein
VIETAVVSDLFALAAIGQREVVFVTLAGIVARSWRGHDQAAT